MLGCNYHSFPKRPEGGTRSGTRWASMSLAVVTLCAATLPYGAGIRNSANDPTDMTGLESVQTQAGKPFTTPLGRSSELWKFRRTNSAAIGAR
jgi:hypothetical protein